MYNYADHSYSKNFPTDFWTVGLGVGMGLMFRIGDSKHGVGNFSLGFQLFPADIPNEMEGDYNGHAVTWSYSSAWWYITGPGSVIELKFTLGGIF